MVDMKEKKNSNGDFDDGRVIANMDIDGIPPSIFKIFAFGRRKKKNDEKDAVKIANEEKRRIAAAIAFSYILFGIVFFGIFALFILFCLKVWFK
ncbi:MAG TPA: hypothetical protein GXX49_00625 [Clostridiaceae bacterium]|nr:hypothetical protein [Clostridiaceae bacterium]